MDSDAELGAVLVDDPNDALVADFVGLRDRQLAKPGRHPGRFLTEGDLVTERALRAGHQLLALLVEADRSDDLPAHAQAAIVGGARLLAAGPSVVEAITGSRSQRGSMAVFQRPAAQSVQQAVGDRRTVVVLEGVVNPINLGLIARSSVAMGAEAFLMDPTCADPFYRRASRVSMGEVFAVPHARLDEFPAGLDPLRGAGFALWALTPASDAVDIADLRLAPDDRVALLVGSEGPGLNAGTMAAADVRVRIPVQGGVDSLNVGAAAAVAAYALGRARSQANGRGN